MRTVLATLTALALTLGLFAWARGEEPEAPDAAAKALQDRVQALEMEVRYLRSREEDTSAYLVQNAKRADGLDAVAKRARTAGFEAKSIPAESRQILLQGMEDLALSLRQGLPAATVEQLKLLKLLETFRQQAGLDK